MTPLALLALAVLVVAVLVAPLVAARRGQPVRRAGGPPLPTVRGPGADSAGGAGGAPGSGSRIAATTRAADPVLGSPIDPDRVEARLRHSIVRSFEAAVDRDPRAVAEALRRMMREPPAGRS